jgi:hypothetical protein
MKLRQHSGRLGIAGNPFRDHIDNAGIGVLVSPATL